MQQTEHTSTDCLRLIARGELGAASFCLQGVVESCATRSDATPAPPSIEARARPTPPLTRDANADWEAIRAAHDEARAARIAASTLGVFFGGGLAALPGLGLFVVGSSSSPALAYGVGLPLMLAGWAFGGGAIVWACGNTMAGQGAYGWTVLGATGGMALGFAVAYPIIRALLDSVPPS